MRTLATDEVGKSYRGRRVVNGVSLRVDQGEVVGLLGPNGAGKTTTFYAIVGLIPPDTGRVLYDGQDITDVPMYLRARQYGISYLPQEASVFRKLTVEENILAVLEAQPMSWHERREKMEKFIDELGLEHIRQNRGYALSGGERRRVELARVLFADADLLLLDEPTNHLDSDAKSWLMEFLRNHRGSVIVVSHDLMLLDEAISRVLHLDAGRLVEYRGTYSQYQQARKLEEKRLTSLAVRQEAEIKRLSLLAEVMRRQTEKRARTAKAIFKRVDRLKAEKVAAPKRERKVKVHFPDPPHSGRVVLTVEALAKGYGGPVVFRDVNFEVERGQRLLVMGLNGAGKTSLLRILAGKTEPNSGRFLLGHGVSMGYYAQEHEGIRAGVPVLAHMRDQSDADERLLRALLGTFSLTGDIARQDAGTLSGGEKTKLALAQLVAGRHNLLLLDEPTNNLDPPSRTGVAVALAAWPGTMVIVSHDPEFVEALRPQRVLFMPEGRIDYWEEDLLDVVSLA